MMESMAFINGFRFEFANQEIEQPPFRIWDRLRVRFEMDDGDSGSVRIRLMQAAV